MSPADPRSGVGACEAAVSSNTARLLGRRRGLGFFQGLVVTCTASSVLLLAAIIGVITWRAWPAFQHLGLGFLWHQHWNPITDSYGALPLIFGTLVTSLLALAIASPLGLGVAILLCENLLPRKIRVFFGFVVELLASIPSVIYGLWGIAVVIPLATPIGRWLFLHFHDIPFFSTPPVGPGVLPASLVLAIMILPTIAALSRSSLMSVPSSLAEGAYALGARRWMSFCGSSYRLRGLGSLARSCSLWAVPMGETMALAMLVGNNSRISASLLAPANTIASLLANNFGEASGIQLSALMYLAFILMMMTFLMNLLAQGLLSRIGPLRAST